jgi:hypothetical protein
VLGTGRRGYTTRSHPIVTIIIIIIIIIKVSSTAPLARAGALSYAGLFRGQILCTRVVIAVVTGPSSKHGIYFKAEDDIRFRVAKQLLIMLGYRLLLEAKTLRMGKLCHYCCMLTPTCLQNSPEGTRGCPT